MGSSPRPPLPPPPPPPSPLFNPNEKLKVVYSLPPEITSLERHLAPLVVRCLGQPEYVGAAFTDRVVSAALASFNVGAHLLRYPKLGQDDLGTITQHFAAYDRAANEFAAYEDVKRFVLLQISSASSETETHNAATGPRQQSEREELQTLATLINDPDGVMGVKKDIANLVKKNGMPTRREQMVVYQGVANSLYERVLNSEKSRMKTWLLKNPLPEVYEGKELVELLNAALPRLAMSPEFGDAILQTGYFIKPGRSTKAYYPIPPLDAEAFAEKCIPFLKKTGAAKKESARKGDRAVMKGLETQPDRRLYQECIVSMPESDTKLCELWKSAAAGGEEDVTQYAFCKKKNASPVIRNTGQISDQLVQLTSDWKVPGSAIKKDVRAVATPDEAETSEPVQIELLHKLNADLVRRNAELTSLNAELVRQKTHRPKWDRPEQKRPVSLIKNEKYILIYKTNTENDPLSAKYSGFLQVEFLDYKNEIYSFRKIAGYGDVHVENIDLDSNLFRLHFSTFDPEKYNIVFFSRV